MTAHSKLPWAAYGKLVFDVNGFCLAEVGTKDDAALIVTAVNARAGLVEALEECREHFAERAEAEYFTDSASPKPNAEMRLLAVVDAALLSVRKGEVK